MLFAFIVPAFAAGVNSFIPFTGSGTIDDPYIISSTDELFALAASVNSGNGFDGEYFLLNSDIDMSGCEAWTPIGDGLSVGGSAPNTFRGHFSGGGHSIIGLETISTTAVPIAGLFGYTEGGSVSGLTVTCAYIGGTTKAAGIAVYSDGTVFENVSFEGSVFGVTAAGGIVGTISGGCITNCSVSGEISSNNSAGGIAGGAENTVISDCEAYVYSNGFQYVGGIAGIAGTTEFVRSEANGFVSSSYRGGGIVGFCFDCGFDSCMSFANVICDDYAGGLVGLAQTSEFISCENHGELNCGRFSGGLAGLCCGCVFTDCANRGVISGEDYIGGLIGWSDDGLDFGDGGLDNRLFRCMNIGSVNGEWGVGGLIGDAHDAFVYDCFNIGEISSVEYAGGLTGYSKESSFERCYNAGYVPDYSDCGALVGCNSMNSGNFVNCVYLSSVCPAGSGFGAGRTEAELTSESAYDGFDFENVWIIPDAGYPFAELREVPSPVPLLGDADGNGEVTTMDALATLRFAMGIMPCSLLDRFRTDMDRNGVVDASDALTVLRISMGMI